MININDYQIKIGDEFIVLYPESILKNKIFKIKNILNGDTIIYYDRSFVLKSNFSEYCFINFRRKNLEYLLEI